MALDGLVFGRARFLSNSRLPSCEPADEPWVCGIREKGWPESLVDIARGGRPGAKKLGDDVMSESIACFWRESHISSKMNAVA
jgi:hypothetical protein